MARVRAAVLVKPKTLEAREFARPAIGLDDALLRIEACGICGSDYEQYEGAAARSEDYTPYPVIPGHEPLGIIEEIGARARAALGRRRGRSRRGAIGLRLRALRKRARAGSRAHCPTRGGTYGYTDVAQAALYLGWLRRAHVPLALLGGQEDGPEDPGRRRRHVQPARGGPLVGGLGARHGGRRPRRDPRARASAGSAASSPRAPRAPDRS